MLDGVEQVTRRGIHGLAAGDDVVDAERAQDIRHALACGDRDEREGLALFRITGTERRLISGNAVGTFLALEHHVVDEDLGNLTAVSHVGEHRARRVRVHVHLEIGMGADEQFAIAERGEEIEGFGNVDLVAMQQELRAVHVVGTGPVAHVLYGHLRLGVREVLRRGKMGLLAGQRRDEALDEDGQAKAAGIDDAVFLENG